MGEITSIVYTPEGADPARPEDRYARVPAQAVQLVVGKGIDGDRKGANYPARQINLMAAETVAQLASEGFKAGPGELGEQIIVRGVDVDSLQPGDRLQLGDHAVLEVDKARTGCDRFEHIQGKRKSEARGRLGQMMRVITGGMIRVDDRAERIISTPRR